MNFRVHWEFTLSIRVGSGSGSGSGFFLDPDPDPVEEKKLDPDPVCYKRLDPDPVNIRPDPKPWGEVKISLSNLLNYFSVSGDSKQKKISHKKVVL